MRLDILDRGHRLLTKALLAVIRLVSRQPVVDSVKLALYRPDFYSGGDLTHEAMRGPSASVGRRSRVVGGVRLSGRRSTVLRRRAHRDVKPVVPRCREGHCDPRRCGHRPDRRTGPGDASFARQADPRARHRCRRHASRADAGDRCVDRGRAGRLLRLRTSPTGQRVRLRNRKSRGHGRRCQAPLAARLPIGRRAGRGTLVIGRHHPSGIRG